PLQDKETDPGTVHIYLTFSLCVPFGSRPEGVDGAWGPWTPWGDCSRTCGGGAQSSNKCLSECHFSALTSSIQDCPPGSQDFREMQCSEFDSVPFRGKFYTWKTTSPLPMACSLTCLAEGFNFYTERAAAVVDGTPCRPDTVDICVSGECKNTAVIPQLCVCVCVNGDGRSHYVTRVGLELLDSSDSA
uniref:Uncharacterized protein n=1 Tax=Spermophilus dauricus TaxID=99837 RepID=A0A8C9UUN3_SPEDA